MTTNTDARPAVTATARPTMTAPAGRGLIQATDHQGQRYPGYAWIDERGELTITTLAREQASAAHRAHAAAAGFRTRTLLDTSRDDDGRQTLVTTWRRTRRAS